MPRLQAAFRALIVLALGFALIDSAAGRTVGDLVAQALAIPSRPILHLLGLDVLRNGVELRSPEGWAIRVSEVCDGLGLVVALAALLAAQAPGWRQGLRRLAIGVAAIQGFNLLRIVVLALVLHHAPGAFDGLHLVLFPYLTIALIGVLVLRPARVVQMAALALPLILLWLWQADPLSALLVPPANLILSVLAPAEVTSIAATGTGWSVGSLFLASEDPVALFRAPIRPADFALAMPVLAAAALRSGHMAGLVAAPALMVAALALGAETAVWGLASGSMVVLSPDGTGAFLPMPYARPETAVALVGLMQNVLVHFTLLVLPLLMLHRPRHG